MTDVRSERHLRPTHHLAALGRSDGTTILANLRTSLVITLNPMATAIWEALGEGGTVSDIVELLSELDGAPEPRTLREAVIELLDRLEADGFLSRNPPPALPSSARPDHKECHT